MYRIKKPQEFITTPWKNGLGKTTELAINDDGTLASFDWRLSMATVTQNGVFSNFNGYLRQLILIKGQGISLAHFDGKTQECLPSDKLENLLDFATFNGGNKTIGELHNGEIIDFNIITRQSKVNSCVRTVTSFQNITAAKADVSFIYNLSGNVSISLEDTMQSIALAQGELFQFEQREPFTIAGDNFIFIQFSYR